MDHIAKDCTAVIKCRECNSNRHSAALHPDSDPPQQPKLNSSTTTASAEASSEHTSETSQNESIDVRYTRVCDTKVSQRSCHQICLAKVFPTGHPEKAAKMYVILDGQSNQSLVSPDFFKLFDLQGEEVQYTLSTCAGVQRMAGRQAVGFQIESLLTGAQFSLPPLRECDALPNDHTQIPTPEDASNHPHLRRMASQLPVLDSNTHILLLLGTDIADLLACHELIRGPPGTPHAQRLELGWVIVGNMLVDHSQMTKDNSGPTPPMRDKQFLQMTDERHKDTRKKVVLLPYYMPQQRSFGNRKRAISNFKGLTWKLEIKVHSILTFALILLVFTFLADVSAIINARPLVPVSSDPETPTILTGGGPAPQGTFVSKNMPKQRWRQAQLLAGSLWKHWEQGYLPTLRCRHKWERVEPNKREGGVILMRDKNVQLIDRIWPSKVGLVRKSDVRVITRAGPQERPWSTMTFTRPFTDVVPLCT